jgi:hypothetical protein
MTGLLQQKEVSIVPRPDPPSFVVAVDLAAPRPAGHRPPLRLIAGAVIAVAILAAIVTVLLLR